MLNLELTCYSCGFLVGSKAATKLQSLFDFVSAAIEIKEYNTRGNAAADGKSHTQAES